MESGLSENADNGVIENVQTFLSNRSKGRAIQLPQRIQITEITDKQAELVLRGMPVTAVAANTVIFGQRRMRSDNGRKIRRSSCS